MLTLVFVVFLSKGLPLTEGSTSYNNWISPPAPIYFQIWVMHVANADEVVQSGAKPVLVQKGPYTYRYTSCSYCISMITVNTFTGVLFLSCKALGVTELTVKYNYPVIKHCMYLSHCVTREVGYLGADYKEQLNACFDKIAHMHTRNK